MKRIWIVALVAVLFSASLSAEIHKFSEVGKGSPTYGELVDSYSAQLILDMVALAGYDLDDFTVTRNGVKCTVILWDLDTPGYYGLLMIVGSVPLMSYYVVEDEVVKEEEQKPEEKKQFLEGKIIEGGRYE